MTSNIGVLVKFSLEKSIFAYLLPIGIDHVGVKDSGHVGDTTIL